jgi:peroxiredoxin
MVLTESLYRKVKKGEKAPGFTLRGIDGKEYSLEGFRGKKAVLVVFMCNHCPYVVHKIGAITSLDREFRERGLQVVGINSNDPAKYPEDGFEKMKTFAKERGIEFPYLVDTTQEVARSYGASCTPDPFLLDSELRVAYHGRIDDALEPGTVPSTSEMRDAILQLIEGKPVTVKEKPSIGCSIKWKH